MQQFRLLFQITAARIKATVSCVFPDTLNEVRRSTLKRAEPGIKALVESALLDATSDLDADEQATRPPVIDAVELTLVLPGELEPTLIEFTNIVLPPGVVQVDFYLELVTQLAVRLARSIKNGSLIGIEGHADELMERVMAFVQSNAAELGFAPVDVRSILDKVGDIIGSETSQDPSSVFAGATRGVKKRGTAQAKVKPTGIDPDAKHGVHHELGAGTDLITA